MKLICLGLLIQLIVAQVNAAPKSEFAYAGGSKILLFSIRAGSGKDVSKEFNRENFVVLPPKGGVPDTFRSSFLNVPGLTATADDAKYIVVELRSNGTRVASATFRIKQSANATNWFSSKNLVRTYPRAKKTGIHAEYQRSRKMAVVGSARKADGCDSATGLLGVSWSPSETCSWVKNGGPFPVLFYSKTGGGAFKDNVAYADQLVVYLRPKRTRKRQQQ